MKTNFNQQVNTLVSCRDLNTMYNRNSLASMFRIKLFFSALVVTLFSVTATTASEPQDIMWDALQPANSVGLPPNPIINHSEPATSAPQWGARSSAVVPELNGKRVRIPAYVVPLDGNNDSLSEMLLVPYFGACIHVPPPPPNQIIYINSDEEIDISKLDLYEPVWATGILKTESLKHELAEVSYKMIIEGMERYDPRAAHERKQSKLRKN